MREKLSTVSLSNVDFTFPAGLQCWAGMWAAGAGISAPIQVFFFLLAVLD
jgi:hypothetical protein